MMIETMQAQPTRGKTVVAGHHPNGDHEDEFTSDNSHVEMVASGVPGKSVMVDPIETVGDKVNIRADLMQVDRPYGFVLAGAPLVIIKRKDGSADVYTTPAPAKT